MRYKIENFCSAFANFKLGVYRGEGQPPIWPIPLNENVWYISQHFLPNLSRTIKELESRNIPTEKIAELLQSSIKISLFLGFIEEMKFSPLEQNEKIHLVESLISFLEYYRKEDVFCKGGRNILWSREEVKETLNKIKMTEGNENVKGVIGKLNGRLWLLSESLHGIFHGFAYELHGPYSLKDREILLVKDYYNLNLPEVWPFTAKLGFNRIVSFEVYKDVDIKIDLLGHPIANVSLPDHLQRFQMFVDGKPLINPSKVISNCNIVLEEAANNYTVLTKKDWEKKFIELYFYYIKPCKDLIGKNWKPSPEIYESINREEPEDDFLHEMEGLAKVRELSKEEALQKLKDFYINSIYGES